MKKGLGRGLAVMIGIGGKPKGKMGEGMEPGDGAEEGDEKERDMALDDSMQKIMSASANGDTSALKEALSDWHTIMHS
jgi:hypothetical protein